MTTRTLTDRGIIRADCAYSKSAFIRAAGLTRSSFDSLKRAGLRTVRPTGKGVFVLGADWIAFLREAAT